MKLTMVLIALGTGEHGVGIGKKEYLVEELGEGTVQLMKMIKKTIDPLGLFNPGKVSTIVLLSNLELHILMHAFFQLYPDDPSPEATKTKP